MEQNIDQKDINEEKESNELNNDVNTNNVEILDDMLKSSQHKPEQNIEINVEGNLMQNQDVHLKGQVNNINPEIKVEVLSTKVPNFSPTPNSICSN